MIDQQTCETFIVIDCSEIHLRNKRNFSDFSNNESQCHYHMRFLTTFLTRKAFR